MSFKTACFGFGSNVFGQLGPFDGRGKQEDAFDGSGGLDERDGGQVWRTPEEIVVVPASSEREDGCLDEAGEADSTLRVCAANWTQTIYEVVPVRDIDKEGARTYILHGLSPLVPPSRNEHQELTGVFRLKTKRPIRSFLGADALDGVVDGAGVARGLASMPWERWDRTAPADGATMSDLPSQEGHDRELRWQMAAADDLGRVVAVQEQTGTLMLFDSVADFVQGSGGRTMSFDIDVKDSQSASSDPGLAIAQLVAGASHFLLLLAAKSPSSEASSLEPLDHQLWGWGDDRFAQLSLLIRPSPQGKHAAKAKKDGYAGSSIEPWRPITFFSLQSEGFPERLTQLATGARHSLALTESGAVYAWGANDVGQLGLGSTEGACEIELVQLGDRRAGSDGGGDQGDEDEERTSIAQVSCGSFHTVLVARDGTIWVAGSNADGQLGLATSGGDTDSSTRTVGITHISSSARGSAPFKAKDPAYNRLQELVLPAARGSRIVNLACGVSHTVLSVQTAPPSCQN